MVAAALASALAKAQAELINPEKSLTATCATLARARHRAQDAAPLLFRCCRPTASGARQWLKNRRLHVETWPVRQDCYADARVKAGRKVILAQGGPIGGLREWLWRVIRSSARLLHRTARVARSIRHYSLQAMLFPA